MERPNWVASVRGGNIDMSVVSVQYHVLLTVWPLHGGNIHCGPLKM